METATSLIFKGVSHIFLGLMCNGEQRRLRGSTLERS